ncbi:uncharacterized protein NECHADRAFT_88040 [Fusarium vanettenii 77-13-4]|uniref:Uncharacterized protein n=1 Tax=Fusarium vanettenii (strain ATCC MYA-4622 / CBS 123669 / FGSC 9596 / NRRL 45880 / 77-13-4) TaxID=660122 RepID=C7ZPU7_FUSV7|nr:uncharacterized protein NECHADRAFT_88040 [Fusarium vanettenii 77-13-4]EEU33969.1 predicted protein [Fusarium vanettenii 77-13-4]
MKMLVLALAWVGGINAATPNSQNEDAKLTQESHRVQCFTYLSTYLAPVRSRAQASLPTLEENDGENTQTTFYTRRIHVDELDGSPSSNGQVGHGVASGTFEPLYTNTPLVSSSSETNIPNLGNKKGAEMATGTGRDFFTDTSHTGRMPPNSDSHDGLDIDSGTYGTLLTDTLAPSTMATGGYNSGDLEEPDVASGTYGPFYTDTPALPTLAATRHFTSTGQQRLDVASGTYSPFYRDTPTLWRTKSTTGDGTSATIAMVESGNPVATDSPFTSNN